MPDQRVTELTAIDAVTGVDLVMVIDDPSGTPLNKKATITQLLVDVARTNVSNTFTGDQTVDGDLFVTGEVNPVVLARQKPKIDLFTGTPVGDPAGSRTLLSRSLISGLSLRHDEDLAQGRLSVGNYDTQIYQPLLFEVESFQVHTGVSPGNREERLRVHPSGGVTVGEGHEIDPGLGTLIASGSLAAAALDLREGIIPLDPAVGTGRLYALDVNGYTQVEMRDGNANAVRFASDNILIAKVSGVAITRGQCVYLAGASGANPLVGLARANNLATMPAVGLALDGGGVNAFIRVLLLGTFQLLNTAAFAEGDRLYVSPTIAGSLTPTRPIAPDYAQRVGVVTRSHATQGEIVVLTTAVEGDPRLHAATHEPGGSDALTTLDASTLLTGTVPDERLSANVLMKPLTAFDLPTHAATHASGGGDAVVITALSGFPGADWQYLRGDGTFASLPVTTVAASRLMGRGASGAGAMEEIVLGAGLTMSGTTLNAAGSALPGNLAYVDAANVFTQNQRIRKAGYAALELRDTTSSVDFRDWHIGVFGGILKISPYSDAGVEQANAVSFFRGGSTEWYGDVAYYANAKFYNTTTVGGILQVGGVTLSASLAAIRSTGTRLDVVTGTQSAYAPLYCLNIGSASTGNSLADLTVTGASAFNGDMDVKGGSGTAYNSAPIEIMMASNPRIGFHWPAVVASQIGMDSAGTIRTFDNPGTGYAAFACSSIYTNSTSNSLGDLTVRGATNFQGGLSGTGAISFTYAHLSIGHYFYPGNIANPGPIQGSWFLSSHSSYGLYTNTGMYCAGDVWCQGVSVAGSLAGKMNNLVQTHGPITVTHGTQNAQHNNLTQATCPAGGTGTAAGGWSTAANRDNAIASINAAKADISNIKNVLTFVILALKGNGVLAS